MQEWIFTSEGITKYQHIFMTFDFMFDGGNIRLDPNQFTITTYIENQILVIIPDSSITQTSGFDLDKMMDSKDLACD